MIETGINFGNIHSYHDLGLILSSVNIPPAEPKTNYINIPGGDGSIDLTEAHGEVKYNDRKCSFVFTVKPDDVQTFETRQTLVSNAINGRRAKITLDKEPAYFYNGRLTVDQYKQNKNLKQITITAQVEPYKYRQEETKEIIEVTETAQLYIIMNGRKSVVPTITCTDKILITFDGNDYTLNAGTHRIVEISLHADDNLMWISGAGTVTISYQEGDL